MMKKLLALLLAVTMIFALCACDLGGKPSDSTPADGTQGSTQDGTPSGTQGGTQGGGDVQVEAVDWPTADYISESMEYTGTGTIVRVSDEQTRGNINVTEYIYVKINGSSLDDVGNYISKLKENGFEYYEPMTASSQHEPELAFTGLTEEYQFFEWRGQDADGHYLDLELLEKTTDDYWVDSDWNEHPFSYNLTITLYSKNYYAD